MIEPHRFHDVVLHSETPVFITVAIAAIVAEVESGSTYRATVTFSLNLSCNRSEIQKRFTKPTMLHGAMPPETCFAAPLHTSFS